MFGDLLIIFLWEFPGFFSGEFPGIFPRELVEWEFLGDLFLPGFGTSLEDVV